MALSQQCVAVKELSEWLESCSAGGNFLLYGDPCQIAALPWTCERKEDNCITTTVRAAALRDAARVGD